MKEYKIIHRSFTLSNLLDDNPDKILTALANSEAKEDWMLSQCSSFDLSGDGKHWNINAVMVFEKERP